MLVFVMANVIDVPSPTVQWGPWAIPLAAIPIIFFVIRALTSSGRSSNSSSGDGPPPGWYDDPRGSDRERWWDGIVWGEQTRRRAPAPTPVRTTPRPRLAQSISGSQETGWCVACGCRADIVGSFRALRNGREYREGACAICGGPVSTMTGYE